MNESYSNVMAVLSSHANHKEGYLISQIFNQTGVIGTGSPGRLIELKNILERYTEVFGYYQGMWSFYQVITDVEKAIFDVWFDGEIFNLKK